jgi:hypothetical protein
LVWSYARFGGGKQGLAQTPLGVTAAIGPTPPPNTILQIKVGTNIVMTSTGNITTWNLVPMYSTNIANQLWTPVPSFTN